MPETVVEDSAAPFAKGPGAAELSSSTSGLKPTASGLKGLNSGLSGRSSGIPARPSGLGQRCGALLAAQLRCQDWQEVHCLAEHLDEQQPRPAMRTCSLKREHVGCTSTSAAWPGSYSALHCGCDYKLQRPAASERRLVAQS